MLRALRKHNRLLLGQKSSFPLVPRRAPPPEHPSPLPPSHGEECVCCPHGSVSERREAGESVHSQGSRLVGQHAVQSVFPCSGESILPN